jgi:hypothetical protein
MIGVLKQYDCPCCPRAVLLLLAAGFQDLTRTTRRVVIITMREMEWNYGDLSTYTLCAYTR